MTFTPIDFETATAQRYSPCEIGFTVVKNGEIVEMQSFLIRPLNNEYAWRNTEIHGICAEDTKKEPEFDELWTKLREFFDGQFLIAHNASFDMSVLRATLEKYELPFPTFNYGCSYVFSRKVWPESIDHKMATLCRLNDIRLDNHHRAGADSRATAELCLKAFEKVGASSVSDFFNKIRVPVKQFDKNGNRRQKLETDQHKTSASTLFAEYPEPCEASSEHSASRHDTFFQQYEFRSNKDKKIHGELHLCES